MFLNNGELSVSNFTWTAMVRPSGQAGPLFDWSIPADTCETYHPHIDLTQAGSLGDLNLTFGICRANVSFPHELTHPQPLSPNVWYTVSVAYKAKSGFVQMKVDSIVAYDYLGAPGINASQLARDDVYLGSTSPIDGSEKYFSGDLACVALWNTTMDLTQPLPVDTKCINV